MGERRLCLALLRRSVHAPQRGASMKQSWKLTAVNRWTQFSHKWVAERYSQHDQSLHYMTYFKTLLSKMTMQATNTFSTLDEMRRLETPLDK